MAKVLLLAALAMFVSPAVGLTYKWNGGNMGFSNTANWQGAFAPVAPNNPCSTTFGGANATIISNLAATTYNIGQTLNLPADGTLLLANDGTVLNFADSSTANCGSQNAIWTGGLIPEQRNDFACHLNWLEDRSPLPSVTATVPPCAGDTLTFDDALTYHVVIGPNVPLIAVGSVEIGSTIITSNTTAQLSQTLPEINLISRSTVVFIGTDVRARNEVCGPMSLLENDANGRPTCICTSSCPTPAMDLKAQNRSLQAAINQAAITLAAMNTYYVRTFTGTMNAASLFMQPAQLGTALNNPADATNSAVAAAVRTALLGLPAASVTGVSVVLSSDNTTVTVTGTINATAGSLLPIGMSTTTPPNNIVWASTTGAIPANVTRTQMLVQSALSAKIFEVYAGVLQARATQQTQLQTAAVQDILNSILGSSNPTSVLNAIQSTPCLNTCASDNSCATCKTQLQTALTNAGVSNPATVAQEVANVASAGNFGNTLSSINSIVETTVNARSALNSSSQVAMRSYTLTAPTLYIGRSATQATQLLAVASQNNANVARALSNSLTGYQTISTAIGLTISYVNDVGGSGRRAIQTSSGIAVNFNYNTSCLPSDTACQAAFTSGSSVGTLINQRLDDTFNLLALQLSYGQCVSLSIGFNSTCLGIAGRAACTASLNAGSNVTVAQQDTYNAIFNLIKCGIQPSFPNGACLNSNPNAAGDAQSLADGLNCGATTTPAPTQPPASSAASSGGGMSIVPIAAAAGGGALLIAIIALLVLRRKRNATPAKKVDERTVVAFENPMYDDPTHNTSAQPVYDAAAPTDGEGLYDEPAFNQAAQKANPVYQSTEDLAAGSEYMEQPGKADGYLDVAPGGAEDVGYLDGVEKQ